jgi:glyoxylase I family protein
MEFRTHHVSISVRDVAATTEFYRLFGFEPVFRMDDVDLSIAHLARPDGLMLEVFRYPENEDAPKLHADAGNDMEAMGVKHFAFRVDDVRSVHGELVGRGYEVTEVRHGRADVDFFFVADPDGMWVEILQDDRDLTPAT